MAGVTVERFWQLTPAELFFEIDAWQKREEKSDFRIGLLCSVIAEPNRNKKKRKKPFTPQDFMPQYAEVKEKPKPQTWQDQLQIVEMLNIAYGGTDERGRDTCK